MRRLRRRDEDGYIGALAVMVLAVLVLLGTAAVTLAAQYRGLVARHYHQSRAYYIAEAGVEKALADPAFLSGLPIDDSGTLEEDCNDAASYLDEVEFAGGTLSVSVSRKPDEGGTAVFRIYSTGRVRDEARVLKTEVRMPLLSFSQGLLANASVELDTDFLKEIADCIYASEGPDHGFMKTFTTADLDGISGVHFVDGNVVLDGVYNGRATIVCTGAATINNLTRYGNDGVLAVLADGDVIVNGDAAVLVCARGAVSLSSSAGLHGAVIAGGDVRIENGSGFIYDEDMAENPPLGLTGRPKVITWQEKYPAFSEGKK